MIGAVSPHDRAAAGPGRGGSRPGSPAERRSLGRGSPCRRSGRSSSRRSIRRPGTRTRRSALGLFIGVIAVRGDRLALAVDRLHDGPPGRRRRALHRARDRGLAARRRASSAGASFLGAAGSTGCRTRIDRCAAGSSTCCAPSSPTRTAGATCCTSRSTCRSCSSSSRSSSPPGRSRWPAHAADLGRAARRHARRWACRSVADPRCAPLVVLVLPLVGPASCSPVAASLSQLVMASIARSWRAAVHVGEPRAAAPGRDAAGEPLGGHRRRGERAPPDRARPARRRPAAAGHAVDRPRARQRAHRRRPGRGEGS